MTVNLPSRGDLDWDDVLNAAIREVETIANEAETPVEAQAKADAARVAAVAAADVLAAARVAAITAASIGAKPASYFPAWGEISSKPTTFAPSAHVHSSEDVTGLAALLDAKTNVVDNLHTVTGTYTLVASDWVSTTLVLNSASDFNVTIPQNIGAAGSALRWVNIGAGQVTFLAGSGVTLGSRPNTDRKTNGQFSTGELFKAATNTVVLAGDITT